MAVGNVGIALKECFVYMVKLGLICSISAICIALATAFLSNEAVSYPTASSLGLSTMLPFLILPLWVVRYLFEHYAIQKLRGPARLLVKDTSIIAKLGQVNHICTDKTGVVTYHSIQVARIWIGGREVAQKTEIQDTIRNSSLYTYLFTSAIYMTDLATESNLRSPLMVKRKLGTLKKRTHLGDELMSDGENEDLLPPRSPRREAMLSTHPSPATTPRRGGRGLQGLHHDPRSPGGLRSGYRSRNHSAASNTLDNMNIGLNETASLLEEWLTDLLISIQPETYRDLVVKAYPFDPIQRYSSVIMLADNTKANSNSGSHSSSSNSSSSSSSNSSSNSSSSTSAAAMHSSGDGFRDTTSRQHHHQSSKTGSGPLASPTFQQRKQLLRYRHVFKGAADVILSHCTHYVDAKGAQVQLDQHSRGDLGMLCGSGLRVVAVAYVPLSIEDLSLLLNSNGKSFLEAATALRNKIVLVSLIGIQERVRPNVSTVLQALGFAGVSCHVLSGDHLETTVHVAETCKLYDMVDKKAATTTTNKAAEDAFGTANTNMSITGWNFHMALSVEDDEHKINPVNVRVLARATGRDKMTFVKTLDQQNQVTCVVGEGQQDLEMLAAADVSVCLYTSSDEQVQEACNVCILDDNWTHIGQAFAWGRQLFVVLQAVISFQMALACSIWLTSMVTLAFSVWISGEELFSFTAMTYLSLILSLISCPILAFLDPDVQTLKGSRPFSMRNTGNVTDCWFRPDNLLMPYFYTLALATGVTHCLTVCVTLWLLFTTVTPAAKAVAFHSLFLLGLASCWHTRLIAGHRYDVFVFGKDDTFLPWKADTIGLQSSLPYVAVTVCITMHILLSGFAGDVLFDISPSLSVVQMFGIILCVLVGFMVQAGTYIGILRSRGPIAVHTQLRREASFSKSDEAKTLLLSQDGDSDADTAAAADGGGGGREGKRRARSSSKDRSNEMELTDMTNIRIRVSDREPTLHGDRRRGSWAVEPSALEGFYASRLAKQEEARHGGVNGVKKTQADDDSSTFGRSGFRPRKLNLGGDSDSATSDDENGLIRHVRPTLISGGETVPKTTSPFLHLHADYLHQKQTMLG